MKIENREKAANISFIYPSKYSIQNKIYFLVFFYGNRNESSVNYRYEIIFQQTTTLKAPSSFILKSELNYLGKRQFNSVSMTIERTRPVKEE